jgi:hypothetical protein
MKNKETVFRIGGEGGSVAIHRIQTTDGTKFLYKHNEFDPIADETLINIETEYDSFEEPFQFINDSFPWYRLYFDIVHDDYKRFVIEKLLEKLNADKVDPELSFFPHRSLAEILQIALGFNEKKCWFIE